MTTPAPTPTKPEPFEITCQACERRGWKGEACSRCDGTRYTSIWDCGRCGEEFDGREVYINLPHREHVLQTKLVTYTVGCREYTFCANCAPAEAIGDGAGLRAMLADLLKLKARTEVRRSDPDYCAPEYQMAVIRGHAASIEAALLDLALWAGVAVSEP